MAEQGSQWGTSFLGGAGRAPSACSLFGWRGFGLSLSLKKEKGVDQRLRACPAKDWGQADLVNQSAGMQGTKTGRPWKPLSHFFAKWGRWSIPWETISTKSGCLVKNGPVRGSWGIWSCCNRSSTAGSPSQPPKQGVWRNKGIPFLLF